MRFFRNDPIGLNRHAANLIVSQLIETWTPERKVDIEKYAKETWNAILVERVQIADYDLTLWYYPKHGIHAVGLNSEQENPIDPDVQDKEVHVKPQWLRWRDVERQLDRWLDQYGKLLVGSAVPARTQRYRKLLSRHFLIGEWDTPSAGFYILPE